MRLGLPTEGSASGNSRDWIFPGQLRQVREILALMKHKIGIILIMTLGAVVLASCGDENPFGVAGVGLVCASDNSDVGETVECPNSTDVIDFCVDGRSGNCYYEVGGEQVNCGNCFGNPNLAACAQEAVDRCDG